MTVFYLACGVLQHRIQVVGLLAFNLTSASNTIPSFNMIPPNPSTRSSIWTSSSITTLYVAVIHHHGILTLQTSCSSINGLSFHTANPHPWPANPPTFDVSPVATRDIGTSGPMAIS